MKLQLDTTNKEITIEESVNLHDLYETLNDLLPGGKWREFTLKVEKIIKWKDPINLPPFDIASSPSTNPHRVWYTTTSDRTELTPGTYNIQF